MSSDGGLTIETKKARLATTQGAPALPGAPWLRRAGAGDMGLWDEASTELERMVVALRALDRCGWNQTQAARVLGTRREYINRRLKTWGGAEELRRQVQVASTKSLDLRDFELALSESQDHRITGQSGSPVSQGGTVTPTESQKRTYLTVEGCDPHLDPVASNVPWTLPDGVNVTEAIPAVQVELDPEEDFFISQRIAVARLAGGPKTRAGILKQALRFFMEEVRKRETPASVPPASDPEGGDR